jgi:ferric-dicitrate binding protein FerR (iron transport regulator)
MSRQVLDSISEQAIDWMVELNAGHLTPACPRAFSTGWARTLGTNKRGTCCNSALAAPARYCAASMRAPPGQTEATRRLLLQPTTAAATCCAPWQPWSFGRRAVGRLAQ